MAAAASSAPTPGNPVVDDEVAKLLAGLNNEEKTAPAANVREDLEQMLIGVPEATQEEADAAEDAGKEKKAGKVEKKHEPATPEKKPAKPTEAAPKAKKKASATTVASKKAGAAKEMREKVNEVLELREKIKEATRKKKLTEDDVAEGLRRELAAIESGKRPERQAKGISKLKLKEQTARERIYDLDPKNKVPSDGYLDGDGGAETEEEDDDYVAGEEEGDEAEEKEEESDKDEGEGEDGDDEEEEKLAEKLAPKKKKAKVVEEDETPKPRKRRVSVDSDGAPMAELVDEDEDDDDGVVLNDDDDGEDDDPEADMESVEDVSKFGVSDFLDIAASVKKRGTKRKAPKTKTPEEIKLEEAIQAECEWPATKLEPEGIVHRGEVFVDHDPKVHDWRTKATYKQLSIQLRMEDGKPIWDFGILYTDDEGEEQFAPLRATKDWGNKGIDMAAVRRSKNQRKSGARILPIVSTSKMANYVRAQLNKQKNNKPRARANGVARLNAPPPPATGTLTLEDAFAAKGKAKPKPKEAPAVNKGKREATTDLSAIGVLEGKMQQLATLITKSPAAQKSMVEKIREWDAALLEGFKDTDRDPLHVMQDALFPTRNEEVDPGNAAAVKLSAKFKAAARLAVMFVCAYNTECRRIILGIPDKKPEEELSALDKLFV